MTWQHFNLVDAIVVIFLIGGLVGGIRRGLSGELARMLIAAGCVATLVFYTRPVADWLVLRFPTWSTYVGYLVAVAACLLGAFAVLTAVRLLLARILNFSFKGPLEKGGGAVFGLLRSGAVAALLLLLLSLLPNDTLRTMISIESRIGNLVTVHLHPWYERLAAQVPELNLGAPAPRDEADPDAYQPTESWEVPVGPVRKRYVESPVDPNEPTP